MLPGESSSDGVPGKAANRKQSTELVRRDNVQYTHPGDPNDLEIYPRGPTKKKVEKKKHKKRMKAKGGTNQYKGISEGGRYSVETSDLPEQQDEEEEMVQPGFIKAFNTMYRTWQLKKMRKKYLKRRN